MGGPGAARRKFAKWVQAENENRELRDYIREKKRSKRFKRNRKNK